MRFQYLLPLASLATAAPSAEAARPAQAFDISNLLTGFAKSCRGVNKMSVSVTPQAMTFGFTDVGSKIDAPDDDGFDATAFCVMLYETPLLQSYWRFAVESVTFTGKGSLSGGAKLIDFGTTLGLSVSYQNKGDETRRWWLNSGGFGEFSLKNAAVFNNGDFNGDFSVAVPANSSEPVRWSPCADPDITTSFQFSQQMWTYWGANPGATVAKGYIDNNLKVAFNLKWERCDPARNPYSSYGTKAETGPDYVPHGAH